MEWKLARAYQVHVCKTSTCLRRNREGQLVCKRHAPWPLVERTIVHASGVLDIQRTYRFLNGYSPAILVCLRCNNDIKFVIYGNETKNIGWYLTNYQSKDPSKTYNMSALLGSALLFPTPHMYLVSTYSLCSFISINQSLRVLSASCQQVMGPALTL